METERREFEGMSERKGLAAEFKTFKPLDRFSLIGNYLSLPYKGDGHEAHGDHAKD